jgi:ATP-dependent exoDNAse (exonuclease V) beta subunit
LAEKVKSYEPQLQLYAVALNRTYRRPVSQIHLHFLALQRSVALSPGALLPRR